jgi:phosphoribosylanthranilate isomerase
MVQLHGSEDLGYISELRQSVPSLAIIKAVPVENGASILESRGFDRAADLLIFDTASKEGGGSGVVFDWSVLGGYKGEAPFLVAGGVGPDNANKLLLQCRQFEKFRGVDLNSAVESSPGVKDVSKVAEVIRKMRDV